MELLVLRGEVVDERLQRRLAVRHGAEEVGVLEGVVLLEEAAVDGPVAAEGVERGAVDLAAGDPVGHGGEPGEVAPEGVVGVQEPEERQRPPLVVEQRLGGHGGDRKTSSRLEVKDGPSA